MENIHTPAPLRGTHTRNASQSARGLQPSRHREHDLDKSLLTTAIEYGRNPSPDNELDLLCLYTYWAGLRTLRERLRMLVEVTLHVEHDRGITHPALLPFVVADDDHSLVSSAALNLAVLVPLRSGKILTGPRHVLNLAFREYDFSVRTDSIVTGVLLLGDTRVNPLIEQAWPMLDAGQREALARAHTPFLTSALIDFLLGRLECEHDPQVLDALAAGLIDLRHSFANTEVFEIERILPVWFDSKEPMRLLRTWTVEAFGERIRPRLESVTANNPNCAAKQAVLAAWTHGGH